MGISVAFRRMHRPVGSRPQRLRRSRDRECLGRRAGGQRRGPSPGHFLTSGRSCRTPGSKVVHVECRSCFLVVRLVCSGGPPCLLRRVEGLGCCLAAMASFAAIRFVVPWDWRDFSKDWHCRLKQEHRSALPAAAVLVRGKATAKNDVNCEPSESLQTVPCIYPN